MAQTPSPRKKHLDRARLAAELADRALDPIDPLRAGSSIPLALSLYREAAYWALLGHGEAVSSGNLREIFQASPRELLLSAAGGEESLATVRNALLDKTFVQTADDPAKIARQDTELARDFVNSLIDAGAGLDDRVGKILLQRRVRVGAALLLFMTVATAGWTAHQRTPRMPDIAAGKPWRASSQLTECRPKEKSCGGAKTAIFFHTREERDPWLEIDLGAARRFSLIEVVNRVDCCPDRAIPLVIEIRSDQENWRTIARRVDTFQEWDAKFRPVVARYVRLRVDRRSTLHLERVSVRAQ